MTTVVIGPREEKQIKRMIEHATANPVRWDQMKAGAIPIAEAPINLTLKDRERGARLVRPASEHIVLGNVRVAYSHEEQPSGMFRHLSASVRRPGKLPHPMAIAMICEAFGFSQAICSILLKSQPVTIEGHIWLEEFDPGHSAVNVIERIAS